MIFTEAAQGSRSTRWRRTQKQVAEIVGRDPNVGAYNSSIGASGPNATGNGGRVFIRLKPRAERISAEAVVAELRPKLAQVPGIRAFPQITPPIRIGGQVTKALYQITLQGADTAELYKYAPILEERLRDVAGLEDVASDLQIKSPQVHVEIDRDRAIALSVTAQQVEDALYTAYGTRQISTIYAPNNQYRVSTELLPEYQRDPATMGLLSRARAHRGARGPGRRPRAGARGLSSKPRARARSSLRGRSGCGSIGSYEITRTGIDRKLRSASSNRRCLDLRAVCRPARVGGTRT